MPIGLDGWELMLTPPPGRMVMLYPLSRTGAARAIFYYTSQSNGTDRLDTRQQKQLVADRFADVGWVVPRMLDAMWAADDFYTDRPAKVAIDRWSRGRAVLVGDSAFAGSVGMGTSLALVGAYVLASELAASGADHRQAFARYEQAMRPFVERNVKPLPGGLRAFLPPTGFDVFMRNLFLRVIPHLPMKGMMSGDIQDAASAITLDESPKAMVSMPLGTTAIESGGMANVTASSARRV